MSEPASFVPRDLLDHPTDFGVESEPTWHYAGNLDEALRLSRAIDQHTQALGIDRWLRRGGHSITDLAGKLGERPETLAGKLRGRRPAPERDLILWSWLTGAERSHVPLAELCADGLDEAEVIPALGVPARRRRFVVS